MLAGEVDGGDDVLGLVGCYRVGTRRAAPGAEPAKGLRQRRSIGDGIGIFERLEYVRAGGAARLLLAHSQWRGDLQQCVADLKAQFFPAGRRGPGRLARPGAAEGPWRSSCLGLGWR